MMRITNLMMVSQTVRNINNAAQRVSDAQNAVASESKIQRASDDPVVATRAVKYRSYVSSTEQYQDNVDSVTSWQDYTDTALSDLVEVMQSIREDIVQASSETQTDDDLAAIQDEIESMQSEVIEIMNTSYAGRYIFAGYDTGEEPYALETVLSASAATTNTTSGYTASSIMCMYGLSSGTYTLNATLVSGTTYNLSLINSDGEVVASASGVDVTGSVTLTGNEGETLTLSASTTGTLTDGGSMTFDTSKIGSVITYKGEILSAVWSSDVDDTTIENFYNNTTQYETTKVESIKYNIGFDEDITVNIEGQNVVGEGIGSNLFDTLSQLLLALENGGDSTSYKTASTVSGVTTITTGTVDSIDSLLDTFDADYDRVLKAQATLGARMDYVDRVTDRLANTDTNYETLKSDNENVDTAEASTEETTAEYVYQAALSVGAKAISKTLVDYLT